MKGTSKEGTGRGMDGGREEASGGGIEQGREGAREGNFNGGILRRALASTRLTLAIRQFAIGESRSLLAEKNKTLRQFG